ncbi:alpha-2,8-polysialyltransferase family protein [Shewanella sp. AS16]|uniref:alpha-2,8-polysialyltransferase family protein n=1 Tax=Shewanella sp. AS16 TaxID=2907625 RepID=UPI001F3C5905|nr:alpha-2,8-polysialyltransferase family protein [Shewanella sp. AS16]MCE9686979.1 alpha-2,8-polysialyltransferase family protein [Shewanella sp. AS16]
MKFYIVGSPWHLIIAAAIHLRAGEKGLFLLEEISDTSLKSMIFICERLKLDYKFIGSISRVRFHHLKLNKIFSFVKRVYHEFESVEEGFSEICALYSPNTVYYFNINSPITRKQLLVSSKLQLKLVRVEDGICDYFGFPFVHYSISHRVMKRLFSALIGLDVLYRNGSDSFQKRTSEYLLFFPKIRNSNRIKKSNLLVYKKNIVEVIQLLASLNKDVLSINLNESSLIIGQTLFEDNLTSLDEEVKVYVKAAKKIGGLVYYKPHPRTSPEKIKKLSTIDSFTIIDIACPVEELLVMFKFNVVVGMWSNTIFYSEPLFDTKSYSLINNINIKGGHVNKILRFIKENMSNHVTILNDLDG